MIRQMIVCALVFVAAACNSSSNGNNATANNTVASNNSTTTSNNSTTTSNNSTTATNNGSTTATNGSNNQTTTNNSTTATNNTVSDPQLLQIDDFEYVGGFRVPADDFGPSSMNFAQGPIAYDAANNSVFLVGHTYQQAVAEFTVPALVNSTTVTDLNIAAAPTQTFVEVMSGLSNPQSIDRISGMALVNGELIVNGQEYYDAPADNTHTSFVVRDPTDLAGSAVDGFFSFGGAAHASGWLSPVPAEWQDDLGGPWITGNSSGTPIIGRLSVGPSAFTFDPADFAGAAGPVSTTTLLDYDLNAPLSDDLSNDTGTNDIWTHLSRAVYGIVWPGTRSYVTFGHTGGHATGVCYKCTPVGGTQDCGGYCSNDTSDYAIYYWFYDVDDLIAVRNGTMAPSDIRPYAYGEFSIPFDTNELGGGTFDPATNTLYLTAQFADRDQGQYANPPVIMAFRVAP